MKILTLLSKDSTAADVAKDLGVSRSHVYNELQGIKVKLDVDTIHGAVAHAMRRGIVL